MAKGDAGRAAKREVDDPVERWFAARGFAPAPFQQAVWRAQAEGLSGVVTAPTGSG